MDIPSRRAAGLRSSAEITAGTAEGGVLAGVPVARSATSGRPCSARPATPRRGQSTWHRRIPADGHRRGGQLLAGLPGRVPGCRIGDEPVRPGGQSRVTGFAGLQWMRDQMGPDQQRRQRSGPAGNSVGNQQRRASVARLLRPAALRTGDSTRAAGMIAGLTAYVTRRLHRRRLRATPTWRNARDRRRITARNSEVKLHLAQGRQRYRPQLSAS